MSLEPSVRYSPRRSNNPEEEVEEIYENIENDYNMIQNEDALKENSFQKTELCPDGWTRLKCSCYLVSTERGNWTESHNDCVKRGGHLAVIDTKEKKESVSQLRTEEDLWIGLRAEKGHIPWAWVDGSTYSFKGWAKDVKEMNVNLEGAVAFVMKGGNWNYTKDGSKHWLCQRDVS